MRHERPAWLVPGPCCSGCCSTRRLCSSCSCRWKCHTTLTLATWTQWSGTLWQTAAWQHAAPTCTQLHLSVSGDYTPQPAIYDVRPWFLHMSQLHTLELVSINLTLRLLVGMGSLRSLRSLSISAYNLIVGAAVSLPPALTNLSLEVHQK